MKKQPDGNDEVPPEPAAPVINVQCRDGVDGLDIIDVHLVSKSTITRLLPWHQEWLFQALQEWQALSFHLLGLGWSSS